MPQQEMQKILKKAFQGKGLSSEEAKILITNDVDAPWAMIFDAARKLTEDQFQKKIYFFAPLYFSNFCINNCIYCGFQARNHTLKRSVLTEDELLQEARFLWGAGYRQLLLIAGEHPVYSGVEQITSYVTALHRAGLDFTLMAEVGPLSIEGYKILQESGVNHCLLFQETYNRDIYAQIHHGRKKDYDWRLKAMERALEAGVEKVGLGILLGLGIWQDDLFGLIDHAHKIKEKFGCFPDTVSFPRLRPSQGAVSFQEKAVSDEDFQKILAISRLTFPEVGIVLTTRETPGFRSALLESGLGITCMSAGSSTVPGGYTLKNEAIDEGQFKLEDHRSLFEVADEAQRLGYEPCFDIRYDKRKTDIPASFYD